MRHARPARQGPREGRRHPPEAPATVPSEGPRSARRREGGSVLGGLGAALALTGLCAALPVPVGPAGPAGALPPGAPAITRGAAAPVVSFATGGQVRPESAGSFAITVQLDQTAGSDVLVPFTLDGTALEGPDYTVPPSPLTIPAGQLSADLVVTLVDDPDPEIVETILVELGTPSLGALGTPLRHLVVIEPSDHPLQGVFGRSSIALPLEIGPAELDFGSLPVGTLSAPLPLVVTNHTLANVTLTAADLLGRQKGEFALAPTSALPVVLAPGASTTIDVTFQPLVGGVRSADVRLQQTPYSILPLRARVTGIGVGAPGADVLVNAAGGAFLDEAYVNGIQERWAPDFGHHGTSWTHVHDGAWLTVPKNMQLFRSARLGATFGYSFELPNGEYDVTVHSIELHHADPGLRLFDVTVEGQLFLDDLDLVAAVGKRTAHSATHRATVADGWLDIDFAGVLDDATVSAIEVRSVGVLTAVPPNVDMGNLNVGESVSLDVTLTNTGLKALTADTLGFRILAGDASDLSAVVGGTSYAGSSIEVTHAIDLPLASGASVVVPVSFAPLEHGQHQVELYLRGDFDELSIDIAAQSGVGGDPYLHPVLVVDDLIVDYDDDGSEGVLLYGADSHTHEPGKTLVAWEWRSGGQLVSSLENDTVSFPVGPHSVELTIYDDNVPAHSLADTTSFLVASVASVPGVLTTYYAASPGGASALLDAVPAQPDHAEALAGLGLPAGTGLGSSGLAGDALVRQIARFDAPAAGTWDIVASGGVDTRILVDGSPVSGPIAVAAGPHALEVRWAVDGAGDLPLDVSYSVDGGAAQSFQPGDLVHDPRLTPPVIHSMPSVGVTTGGNQIVIDGFGFFPSDQVTVHWGATALTEQDFTSWSAGSIEFLSPPGSAGTIQVTVQTPAGTSNARTFEYQFNGPVPIAFFTGVKPFVPDPTAAEWGPDGRLYVVSRDGTLRALTISDNYTVTSTAVYAGVSALSNHEIMGLAFDPFDAPSPVRVYVAHSEMYAQGGGAFTGPSPYTGQVSVLTGPLFDTPVPLITNLPTSNHDHGVNGIAFDHDGDLLICVGGNTNAGVRHPMLGDLPESPLSGAILEARLSLGRAFAGDLLYVESVSGLVNNDQVFGDIVDLAPGRHVSVFASGIRNPFDLVLTTWGSVYATDNGPNNPFGVASLTATTQSTWHAHDYDELNLVEYGHYYGHPNRNRGRTRALENTYFDVDATAQPGFTQRMAQLDASTNGIAEYRAAAFGGQMRGDLIASKFSDVLKRIRLSPDKRSVTSVASILPGSKGLGVCTGPGGALIVSDYNGDKLRFYTPDDAAVSGLTVYDITPWRAPETGGTPFVIGGFGFGSLANTTVTIGGVPASLTSVAPTRIRGTWPALASAPRSLQDVVVTVAGTPKTLPAAALFLPPARGQWLGAWSAGPALTVPLGEVASGVIDGVVYVVGEGSDRTLAYDIATGTWDDTLAKRPFKGHHHAAEVWNGKWYLIGGLGSGSPGKVQVYDPATDQWTTGASMPWNGGSVATARIGGKIYASGGIVGSTTVDDCAVYDIAANSWTPMASMPAGKGRNHAASGTDGKCFFVFGGRGLGSGAGNTVANGYADVQVYDPATNTWRASFDPGSSLPPLPIGRGGTGKAVFHEGRFHVFGGETLTGPGAKPGNVYDRVDVYDPVTNSWSLEAPMTTARHGVFPVVWQDRIYLAGGGVQAGFSASAALEIYTRR